MIPCGITRPITSTKLDATEYLLDNDYVHNIETDISVNFQSRSLKAWQSPYKYFSPTFLESIKAIYYNRWCPCNRKTRLSMANWHERHHNKFVQCNLKEDGEENYEVIWIVVTSGGYFD